MAKGDQSQGGQPQIMPPSQAQQQGIKSINFHPGQGPLAPQANAPWMSRAMPNQPMQGGGMPQQGAMQQSLMNQQGAMGMGQGQLGMGNGQSVQLANANGPIQQQPSPVAPSNQQELIRRIMMGSQS